MKVLPDVMLEKSDKYQQLDWVGMTEIQSAMQVKQMIVPVSLDIGVNLAENSRGIHMSRLYQLQQAHLLNQRLATDTFQKLTKDCLQSHDTISSVCAIKIKLQWAMTTRSLKSNLAGFRQYPVQIIFEQRKNEFKTWLQFEILYSSTCPQSASVALEVIKSEGTLGAYERLLATPHAQRSRSVLKLQVNDLSETTIDALIEGSEQALGTPVQTTVKKIDEMEFARLNANNLMFCEDAARKLANYLAQAENILGYSVYCEHQESLHPHNASSMSAKNYSSPSCLSFS